MKSQVRVKESFNKVPGNDLYKAVLDRRANMLATGEEIIKFWEYDLYKRKPALVYDENGIPVESTLDLMTFMLALARRNAVIVLPEYEAEGPRVQKEGEVVISSENRHGPVKSLVSNQNSGKFSLRIFDANVVSTDQVGEFRTFSITGHDGELYSGWKSIKFMPTAPENSFITEFGLAEQGRVSFDKFVHPSLWMAYYSKHYILTKMFINRVTEEIRHIKLVIKEMEDVLGKEETAAGSYESEPGVSKKIDCFQTELDMPSMTNYYDIPEFTKENLEALEDKKKKLNQLLERARFAVRAAELAHTKSNDVYKVPGWIDAEWEKEVKPEEPTFTVNSTFFSNMKKNEAGPEVKRFFKFLEGRSYDKPEDVIPDLMYVYNMLAMRTKVPQELINNTTAYLMENFKKTKGRTAWDTLQVLGGVLTLRRREYQKTFKVKE